MNVMTKARAVIVLYNTTHEDNIRKTFETEEEASEFLSSQEYFWAELSPSQVSKLLGSSAVMIDLRHIVAVTRTIDNFHIVQMAYEDMYRTFVLCENTLFYSEDIGLFYRINEVLSNGLAKNNQLMKAYVEALSSFDVDNLEESIMQTIIAVHTSGIDTIQWREQYEQYIKGKRRAGAVQRDARG